MVRVEHKLFLYNTASRRKERFEPAGEVVGLYTCGPTVYNYAHIGNLRTYLWEDVLKRTLRGLGYQVRHVMNITDVGHLTSDADTGEDKMEKGSRREGRTVWEIAEHYTEAFKNDLDRLNVLEPDVWARATDHIGEMIDLVRALEEKGYTYTTSDGVYFDTGKFPSYPDFARLDPSMLRAGSRIEMGEKKNATDFALWKFSPVDAKRQMEWDSPWGTGFPGWHIECSAMSLKYLPQPIDIHCGGQEHVRVHHTNEIAQAEAATGKQFVRFWLHGEWLVAGAGKMAKSGGGMVTLEALRAMGCSPLAYKLFAFSAHHRSPLTYSEEGVKAAAQSLRNLKKLVAEEIGKAGGAQPEEVAWRKAMEPFWAALCDDLNIPKAVAALWELLRSAAVPPAVKVRCAAEADAVLALDLMAPPEEDSAVREMVVDGARVVIKSETELDDAFAQKLVSGIVQRKKARKEKDFAAADRIRDELTAKGITLKDLPDGSTEAVIEK
jgi:cysteinyl-tRNA synthetase